MGSDQVLFSPGILTREGFSNSSFCTVGIFLHPGQFNGTVANFYANFLSDKPKISTF
jgi:hypothetical protein